MSETITQEKCNLSSSPLKRRRGRPSLKKNQTSSIIGESTMFIPVVKKKKNNIKNGGDNDQTEEENLFKEAYELSEATAKKGFNSTPIMKLSPSKKGLSKLKLLEIGNNKNLQKVHKDLYSVVNFNDNIKNNSNSNNKNNSNFSSPIQLNNLLSSPIENNIMTSETNYQQSSPLRTSPLPNSKNLNDNNMNRFMNNLQSSPTGPILTNRPISNILPPITQSINEEDNFFKYINSSPIVLNTPSKNNNEILNNININSSYYTNNLTSSPRINRNKYRSRNYYSYNYTYKISVGIDDYGKAKIYARVIENEPLYNDYQINPYYPYYSYEISNQSQYSTKFQNSLLRANNNLNYREEIDEEFINGKSYDQYLNEQYKVNEFRQQVIKKSMKSDPYMTECNDFINYETGYYKNKNTYSNGNSSSNGTNNKFSKFVNQEYDKIKTVNLNNVVNSKFNQAVSSGIENEFNNNNNSSNLDNINKIKFVDTKYVDSNNTHNALLAMKRALLD